MIRPEGYQPQADLFEVLHNAKESGHPVNAVVAGIDYPDGTPTWLLTFLDLPGVKGLVPSSETGLGDPKLLPRFVGQQVRVIVKGVDRENALAACSRREAVAAAEEALKAQLKEGQALDAVVRAVLPRDEEAGKPARVVVDIGGGVLAELPRREAEVSAAMPLAAQYPPGKQVRVVVKSVEPLSIGLAPGPDPWERADFKRGQFLACTVVMVAGRIVFLEPDLAPGVVGIAPAPLRGVVSRGDRLACVVAAFDGKAKKLRLRIRGRA